MPARGGQAATPRPRLARDRLALLGLAGVALLFWKLRYFDPPRWTPEGEASDLFLYVYPVARAAARWIHAGELPLWNPHQIAGHPFLATVAPGLLYPPSALYLVLPTEIAIEALIALHLALAAVFMFCFTRSLGLGTGAAGVAALVFMGSGTVALHAAWVPPALAASVWLPPGCLAIEWVFRGRLRSGAALLAVAVAMPILAGWPQSWVYEIYALAFYAGIRLIAEALARRPARALARPVASLTAGVLLGVALAGAQLLPALELRAEGPRRAEALSDQYLLGLGHPNARQVVATALDPTPGPARRAYLGVLAPALIALSAFARRWRAQVLCLWLLAAGSAALATGPVLAWYRALPMLAWFRQPDRVIELYGFAGSVLAGIGFQVLVHAQDSAGRGKRLALPLLVTALALGIGVATPIGSPGPARLAAGACLVWLALWLPGRRLRTTALGGLALLLAGDVLWASREVRRRPVHGIDVYARESGIFDYLREHQGFDRSFVNFRWAWARIEVSAKQGTLQEIYSITDYEPLSLARVGRFYELLHGIAPGSRAQPFTGFLTAPASLPHFRLLDLLSVRYMLVPQRPPDLSGAFEELGWRPVFRRPDGEFLVLENPAPLPRAYVVHAARMLRDEEAAWDALRDPGFEFRRSALVELEPGAVPPGDFALDRDPTPAAIVRYEPRRVEIEVECAAPGILVLTDTYYPGWRVRVDGVEAPLLRANYLFRGVALAAGRHRVEFHYAPASVFAGAALSGAGALAIALLAWPRGVPPRAQALRRRAA
jgi:hypothetical protein